MIVTVRAGGRAGRRPAIQARSSRFRRVERTGSTLWLFRMKARAMLADTMANSTRIGMLLLWPWASVAGAPLLTACNSTR